jgi:phosphopantetheinyl transferase (holo-ACP synthase)
MLQRESMFAVGNDVVDFAASRWPHHRHAHALGRFSERVCAADERALVAAAHHPERMLWALFAAKEAAYKVVTRFTGGVVFAHRAFVVSQDLTEVRYQDLSMRLQVCRRAAYVHAVAWTGDREPFWQVALLGGTECARAAVRRLATSMLAQRMGCAAEDLSILREPHSAYWDGLGPPRALVRGEPAPYGVSLSHHGRFVSACALSPGADASLTVGPAAWP